MPIICTLSTLANSAHAFNVCRSWKASISQPTVNWVLDEPDCAAKNMVLRFPSTEEHTIDIYLSHPYLLLLPLGCWILNSLVSYHAKHSRFAPFNAINGAWNRSYVGAEAKFDAPVHISWSWSPSQMRTVSVQAQWDDFNLRTILSIERSERYMFFWVEQRCSGCTVASQKMLCLMGQSTSAWHLHALPVCAEVSAWQSAFPVTH